MVDENAYVTWKELRTKAVVLFLYGAAIGWLVHDLQEFWSHW